MTSGEIASRFDCSWPTISGHLRVLEDAGLVTSEPSGRERRYHIDLDRLESVAGAWLGRFDADQGAH